MEGDDVGEGVLEDEGAIADDIVISGGHVLLIMRSGSLNLLL